MRTAPKRRNGVETLIVEASCPKILQDFLAARFSLSRRTAKAMIDGRSVWVCGRCVWMARHALKVGDTVQVPSAVVRGAMRQSAAAVGGAGQPATAAEAQQRAAERSPRKIPVLVRSGPYLVCDKPAGLLTCGAEGSVEDILRTQERLPGLVAVHRLDRDTSGCLLFASSRAAADAAIEAFKRHTVRKTYRAIALGRMERRHIVMDAPLDGKRATTRAALEVAGDGACLLKISIETGRTNQIRRHLAGEGHPVAGDRVFGAKSARDPRWMRVPRQMLHASALELPDPARPKSSIRAHSPLPADFRAALRLFGMGKATPAGAVARLHAQSGSTSRHI